MSTPWAHEENMHLVADYFAMLGEERARIAYSKAGHLRALTAMLSRRRTRPAIEKKHQNVSAIMLELGFPYIDGYKPLSNYQAGLREAVVAKLESDRTLRKVLDDEAGHPVAAAPVDDILACLDSPPEAGAKRGKRRLATPHPFLGVNYLERESRNQALGRAGEEFVVQFEQARLGREGRADLAKRVEHSAVECGDGLGFDVRSFDSDGAERLIEAKTTTYPKYTPFYISLNETEVSRMQSARWHLYRVFDFRSSPRFFVLRGAIETTCVLTPATFTARTR